MAVKKYLCDPWPAEPLEHLHVEPGPIPCPTRPGSPFGRGGYPKD